MSKRTPEQLVRANQQRNYLKTLSRKASFISEYIEIKYPDIYNEALNCFYPLNATYPTKADLRKTNEFRTWKVAMKGEKPKKRRKHNYLENPPESPRQQRSEEPESPRQQRSEETQSPYSPQSSDQPENSQLPEQTENPQSPIENSPVCYNDNMVLRIPLLKSPQTSPPTVTSETIQIVTEQTLEPLTLDDIPPERIEQLIIELQQDPDIKGMFTDIQAQLEFEELGLDIDIPELNLLEDELADW